ncbi:MAG: hypothetical protein ABFS24_11255 [Pseudomonadota bacterium]
MTDRIPRLEYNEITMFAVSYPKTFSGAGETQANGMVRSMISTSGW